MLAEIMECGNKNVKDLIKEGGSISRFYSNDSKFILNQSNHWKTVFESLLTEPLFV